MSYRHLSHAFGLVTAILLTQTNHASAAELKLIKIHCVTAQESVPDGDEPALIVTADDGREDLIWTHSDVKSGEIKDIDKSKEFNGKVAIQLIERDNPGRNDDHDDVGTFKATTTDARRGEFWVTYRNSESIYKVLMQIVP